MARTTTLHPTERLTGLPPYVFAWLDELKAAARARGADLIDLGIGSPDQPTPQIVLDAITRAYADPKVHGYPPFRGSERFRRAAAGYMRERFGADIDPETEVLALSGGKEGIAHLMIGFMEEGALALVPDIYYPVHGRAPRLFGGDVHFMPLRAENGFVPVLAEIPSEVLERARIMVLNYPHNPTGAIAPRSLFEDAVALCREHGIVLLSDLAYSELTFDGAVAPSVFEVEGAKDVAVEIHSCSKSFNMAGSRIGFAVGGAELIDVLHAVRTNMGYGTPVPIQEGAAVALEHRSELVPEVRARYQARRDRILAGFASLGWTVTPSRGSMFVWLPVPRDFTAEAWTEHLIDVADVVVTPGNAFGPGGEGWFRVSLVQEVDVLDQVIERMQRAGIRYS